MVDPRVENAGDEVEGEEIAREGLASKVFK